LVKLLQEHTLSIIFMDDIHWTAGIQSGTGNGDSEVQHTMLELTKFRYASLNN
jgi:ATP-dependent 26S proteasome regulatory subunit